MSELTPDIWGVISDFIVDKPVKCLICKGSEYVMAKSRTDDGGKHRQLALVCKAARSGVGVKLKEYLQIPKLATKERFVYKGTTYIRTYCYDRDKVTGVRTCHEAFVALEIKPDFDYLVASIFFPPRPIWKEVANIDPKLQKHFEIPFIPIYEKSRSTGEDCAIM